MALWILLFTEQCRYFNSCTGKDNSRELLALDATAKSLTLTRSESEWLSLETMVKSDLFQQRSKVCEQIIGSDLQLSESN